MLVSLNNVTFEFGARAIIKDSSWTIFPKERIGLIGANGMGKSTILKLIVGEMTPSSGTLEKPRDTTIGYFHQDLQSVETEESILEVASHAFDKAKAIQKELSALETRLETESTDDLLNKYSELLHDFELAGGYEMEHKSAQILEGLGFTTKDLDRPYTEFSGGWRMRVILAKMILQKPDLLLLDEPTNHLDLPSIQWMEGFLQSYPGTVVIVSHDRYFLDKMVTKIVEVRFQQLNFYGGNYSFYEIEKDIRVEFQQREYENQQDYIRQQERFIERFKAKASKAAAAQSLVKKLDRLEVIEAPITTSSSIKINFNIEQQPGKVIATLENVSKNYGEIRIVDKTNAEIMRGDKIALIGANGKGKSTVLRIIAEQEEYGGTSTLGHNVKASFYAQHQLEALNINHEILEEMKQGTVGYTEPDLRSLLGCFLFQGDDVFKKIKVLSGGEKARVALAKTMISKSNFLMLDEPTNHLDLNSVNMLADALNKYQGSLILVSHDRYFVAKTANKIWEIIDGKINEFIGTYDEYAEFKEKKEALAKANKAAEDKTPEVKVVVKKEEPKLSPSEHKDAQKKVKQVQNSFRKVEEDLEKAQALLVQLESKMADPTVYADRTLFVKAEQDYASTKSKINLLQKEYEVLFEQMLAIEN
jgi:ATP-binding cassette, subfamily F, member 3